MLHSFSINQMDNSQKLLQAKNDISDRCSKVDLHRSKEISSLIQYSITNLSADESHVSNMLSQVTASVNRNNLKQMARSNSQMSTKLAPQSSSKAIKVEVARNGTGLKSRTADDSPPSTPETSPKAAKRHPAATVTRFANQGKPPQPQPQQIEIPIPHRQTFGGGNQNAGLQLMDQTSEEEDAENDYQIQPSTNQNDDSAPNFSQLFSGHDNQQSDYDSRQQEQAPKFGRPQ